MTTRLRAATRITDLRRKETESACRRRRQGEEGPENVPGSMFSGRDLCRSVTDPQNTEPAEGAAFLRGSRT